MYTIFRAPSFGCSYSNCTLYFQFGHRKFDVWMGYAPYTFQYNWIFTCLAIVQENQKQASCRTDGFSNLRKPYMKFWKFWNPETKLEMWYKFKKNRDSNINSLRMLTRSRTTMIAAWIIFSVLFFHKIPPFSYILNSEWCICLVRCSVFEWIWFILHWWLHSMTSIIFASNSENIFPNTGVTNHQDWAALRMFSKIFIALCSWATLLFMLWI